MDLRRPTGKKALESPNARISLVFEILENSWIFKYSNFFQLSSSWNLKSADPSLGSSDRRIPGSRASELFLDWRGSSDPAREPKGCGHQDQELDRSNRTDQIRLERILEFSLLSRMAAARFGSLISFRI